MKEEIHLVHAACTACVKKHKPTSGALELYVSY